MAFISHKGLNISLNIHGCLHKINMIWWFTSSVSSEILLALQYDIQYGRLVSHPLVELHNYQEKLPCL